MEATTAMCYESQGGYGGKVDLLKSGGKLKTTKEM
jgi:hypothetical protein